MFLNIDVYNVIFIGVSYQFLITFSSQFDLKTHHTKLGRSNKLPGPDDCIIPTRGQNDHWRPISSGLSGFSYDSKSLSKYHVVQRDTNLRFTCEPGRTLSVGKERVDPTITVKCTKKKFQFKKSNYTYDDFMCDGTPKDLQINWNSTSKSHLKHTVGAYDCFLQMQGVDYHMPIPFTNSSDPMVIYPDRNGNLIIKKNDSFQMACTGKGNVFVSPESTGLNELTIKCLNGSLLEYNHKIYTVLDFRCASMPKSELALTPETCHNRDHNVFEVGYQTQHVFLKLYRICFDMVDKNAKYSWHFANTPVYVERQVTKETLKYIPTKTFFDIDPRSSYLNQSATINEIVQSEKLTNYYIKRDEGRFLEPGHLMSKKEFIYGFEQWATYYYENTVPQWHLYAKSSWEKLQQLINERLSKDSTRHLIIAGTYNSTYLPKGANVDKHPLYLSLPKSITVPLYIWKMDYDMDRKNGTVYIGANNPYKNIQLDTYFCNAKPCDDKLLARKAFEKDLIFCCSKESFEQVYGPIDPVAYQDF